MTRRRAWSGITVTDQFCGAGGSSQGARALGVRVRLAMNHWKLAVETHNTNFPETDHDCCDISASDPRRYPSTDILITSPECTTHSPAGGNRRRPTSQRDLFLPAVNDPSVERSRATMWDVPRFAEYHRYRRIIVENVIEVLRWELFGTWLQAMQVLGYKHRVVCLNSMFAHPTPQSRDRIYVHFWKAKDRAPDLELRPAAPCARCGVVEAVQTWKNGRTVGKYRTQYVYTCPTCRAVVVPFYYAALNAIDFSIAAERIGDREKPLRERTMERIRYGLEKYGRRVLVVNVKQGARDSSRAWPADVREIGTIPTWDNYYGMVAPFLVDVTQGSGGPLPTPADAALRTQTAQQSHALVAPFLVGCANSSAHGRQVRTLDDPIGTMTGGNNFALVGPGFAPFISVQRSNNPPGGLDDPLAPLCTRSHHMLVQGAALLSMRDARAMHVGDLAEPTMTQGCAPQTALLSRSAFIASQYRSHNVSPVDAPVPSVTTLDRHALVEVGRELRVEDCYFRMLQPHEIGAAMAFASDYVVLGNKRERVKQYGNAVTPPAMELQLERHVQAMTGERAA